MMENWWHHIPEHLSPTVFSFGGISLSWYGVAFLCGTVFALFFLWRVLHRVTDAPLSREEFLDFSLFLVGGAVFGARLGYAALYNAAFFVAHPIALFSPMDPETGAWTGIAGMSAHGGVIGVLCAVLIFSRIYRKPLWQLLDNVALSIPIAIFFGRCGNFLAGELFGRVTGVGWGMVFPLAGDGTLRHPSQLYEALGEGVVLGMALFMLSKRNMLPGRLFAWALGLYGVIRFVLEYAREPDAQIGFVFGVFTMGQGLSMAMIGVSLSLAWLFRRGKNAILSPAR